jgi:molybdopterin-guanine dinucleotide biosynthesis protein A
LENHAHIAAVILAGGLGRRMGGVDKGLLPFADSTLVQQVIARVVPQVDEVLLSTPNTAYARFGYPLIPDAVPGRAGPLAGLLSVLEQARGRVLSVPCDVPRLPVDLVVRLMRCMGSDVDVCCAHDGVRLHPVIALWRPDVAPKLRAYLEKGERRVQGFVESIAHAQADFSDQAACFANVNTPNELQRLENEP